MSEKNITQDLLKELLHYSPDTGEFRRMVSIGKVKRGDIARSQRKDGYIRIGISGNRYYAHRLAWLYMTGEWPEEVDHINKDPSDNSFSNLANGSHRANMKNRKVQKNSFSGIHGVTFNKQKEMLEVRINDIDKRLYYGDDFFEACCIRKSAENKFGYHENHGL